MNTFTIRQNEKVAFLGEVFASREEAEQHSESVTFVADCYAALMGYPCGGFVPMDAWGKALPVHVVHH